MAKGIGSREKSNEALSVGGREDALTVTETSGDTSFVSLHNHDTFSFLDGYGMPAHHAEAAAQFGHPALATTNHGNVTSHAMHQAACKERGLKPIFGCELYTSPVGMVDPTTANPHGMPRTRNHLTALAESQEGYRTLMRLVTASWAEGMFYGDPNCLPHHLDEHAEELVVLSGCTASHLATSLIGGKWIPAEEASYDRAKRLAAEMRDRWGDGFYLEVQAIPDLADVRRINAGYEQLSAELGIPLVATADVHVPKREDARMRQILHAVRAGRKSVEQIGQEWDYTIDCSMPRSDRQVVARLMRGGMSRRNAQQAVANTVEIAQRCNVELPHMPMVQFDYAAEGDDSTLDTYRRWLREGWERRGFNRLPRAEVRRYRERIAYESDLIEGKDYVDYFLIVADMVKYAKRNGIVVGPARGSAGASLICYLLDITEVNPMLYDHLVFERFIDRTREDLPDIDLDFDDRRRFEVFEYMFNKYGHDHTGFIGTYTTYKGKNSLDDVARVNDIPPWELDDVKDVMIERSGGDLRADATLEDTVEMFEAAAAVFEGRPELWDALKLEGNVKGMGIHAAGLIVAPHPLTDVCATYAKTKGSGEKVEVVSFDKHSAEEMGLLKIDVLGLSTMGMLAEAAGYIGWTIDDLYKIPLDDPATIDGFKRNDVDGVFQFDGWSMRMINDQLKPDNFLEVCDVNALARPGPLHNGATNEYIAVKHGDKEADRFHPLLDDITRHTRYQIVYQEQILRICMEVGNFEWTHAAYIRKIISKKIGEQEFARQGETFYEGAMANGLTREEAEAIWGACITAGSYAFNSAHCVAYGMLAWWCMYMKVHHPSAFFAAALNRLPDTKQEGLLRNAYKSGVRLLPPDPAQSTGDWEPVDDPVGPAIRGGLTFIHGIGAKTAERIVAAREGGLVIAEWADLQAVKGIGPKTIERIVEWAASDDPYGVHTLDRKINMVVQAIRDGIVDAPLPTHNAQQVPYDSAGQDVEVVWAGIVEERNLRDLFETNFAKTGVPLNPDEVKRPDLNEWAVLTCRDADEQIHVTTNRWSYPKFRERIWEIKLGKSIIVVRGTKLGVQKAKRVYVDDMWVVHV